MYRRRFLAAKAKYRCEWKCTHCARLNRERGEVHAADRVSVGQFTDNLYDEVSLSGEIAQEKARRKLHLLQEAVNERHALAGLRISGVCRRCGGRQFWSPALRHTWAVMMAAASFAALVWAGDLPSSETTWLACLAAGGAALITESAALDVTRRRLGRLSDPECAPYVEELFPEE